jgi:hypothetical protein
MPPVVYGKPQIFSYIPRKVSLHNKKLFTIALFLQCLHIVYGEMEHGEMEHGEIGHALNKNCTTATKNQAQFPDYTRIQKVLQEANSLYSFLSCKEFPSVFPEVPGNWAHLLGECLFAQMSIFGNIGKCYK